MSLTTRRDRTAATPCRGRIRVRSSRDPAVGRRTGALPAHGGEVATIGRMAVTDDRPVADQLAELGAQLAWVRDYL